MICSKCGTENKSKFKFCVKCGSNLEDPSEVNIEQVDMGGYRSEEDYASEKNSFKIGSGTFTISDRAPDTSSGMFTADELNDTDEEFDFSHIDEPFIPKLDADRVKLPSGTPQPMQPGGMPNQPMQNAGMQGMGMPNQPMQNTAMQGMGMPNQPMQNAGMQGMGMPNQPIQNAGMQGMGMPNQPIQNVGMQGMGMPNQPMQNTGMQGMGMPNQMYGGQPMYGQPMMAQPQIIGYDQSGMPIYGQPMMAQPMVIGYDQNGMPIYGQPMMAQPVVIGYDQNGMPIYGQSQPMMYGMQQQGMSEQGMQAMPGMYGMPQQNQQAYQQPPQQQPAQNSGQVKVPNKFWNDFFSEDGEEGDGQDDFFGKPRQGSGDMGGVSTGGLDMSRLKKPERKKRTYMNDTPDVDAAALKPNENDKLNKMFMRGTKQVNADDLQENRPNYKRNYMGATDDVDAQELQVHEHKKTRVTMQFAGEANADELRAYEAAHKESIMAQADHAVEALPKKKAAVVDEIDAIELPAHMQARKTVRVEKQEIPRLPEV